LTQGWRSEFVLPLLQDVLTGKRPVTVAKPGADTPLTYEPEK